MNNNVWHQSIALVSGTPLVLGLPKLCLAGTTIAEFVLNCASANWRRPTKQFRFRRCALGTPEMGKQRRLFKEQ